MMRLAHPEMKMVLPLMENQATLLAVEHPALFRRLIEDLLRQTQGLKGGFVLTKDWSTLPLEKNLALVTDPFTLNINERRQLTALHKQTAFLANSERLYLKTAQLQSSIDDWLALIEEESPYAVQYETQAQPEALLKQMNFRFLDEDDDFPLRLERFLKVQAEFANVRVDVFLNLRSFLNLEELSLLYRSAFYLKVRLLLLESVKPENLLDCESWFLIDKDLCELYAQTEP